MGRERGTPITFGGCAGFIHDGGGRTGIVLVPAWGFEDMTIRRGWAGLADMLAEAGYACLRFDWPGAGDSLGDTAAGIRFADWQEAILSAATVLRQTLGVERIALVGHGVGALIAPHVAKGAGAEAVVMMAPQSEGQAGLRELDVWSRLIASFLRLPPKASKDQIEIAGHTLSLELAREIAALKAESLADGENRIPALALLRAGHAGNAEWARRLGEGGFDMTTRTYAGWDGFFSQTSASIPPLEDFGAVLGWLEERLPASPRPGPVMPLPAASPLKGPGFTETPVLFGAGDRLFGILCQPAEIPSRGVVVMLNSGDHIGWARMHVHFARQLAAEGISSFRIDTGGIGDAATVEGHLFYVDRQIREVAEAVNALESRHLGPVTLLGRCSGGYAAVQAAVLDPRVRGVVAVNTARLSLGPEETFEDIMSTGTSSMADYKKRALSPAIVKDILTGRLPLSAVFNKGRHILKTQAALRFPALYGALTGAGRLTRTTRQQAETLRSRGVAVHLLYADNDGGLDELARHFGRKPPEAYDHARVRVVAGAEHNMTAPFAREAIIADLREAVSAAG